MSTGLSTPAAAQFATAQRPAGFSDSADCTVRGFAAAAGISYEDAHAIASDAGREPRRRFSMAKVISVAKRRGFTIRKLRFRVRTLARFMREYPRGRYYVGITGHAFAVVDGVPSERQSPHVRITHAYEVIGVATN